MSRFSDTWRELRLTLALALPITLGNVGQILLGLIDSVMIGRVGAVSLAASAFAGALFGVIYVTAIGLLTSIAVCAAWTHGAGQPRATGEVLRHGLAIAVAAAVLCGTLLTGLSTILHDFGQPPAVADAARPFLSLIGWSLVPGLSFLAIKQFYEALHRPWIPMMWVLIGVGVNVGLNWILIYGHLGAPALGLRGAGWSTLLSRTVIFTGLLAHFVRAPGFAAFRPVRWLGQFQAQTLRELFALGGPAALQLLFECGLFTAAAILMGWLGTNALAAHQIALSCAGTTFMFPLGIATALSVRIGHARGAGDWHRLRTIGFGGIGAGLSIMACFALVFLTLGKPIAACFIADPAVIDLAAQLLIVVGFFQLFDGTQVTSAGALRGLADVKTPTIITFLGYWILALPAAWIAGFPLRFGPVGVWSGLALGLAACAAMLALRFAHRTRATAVRARLASVEFTTL